MSFSSHNSFFGHNASKEARRKRIEAYNAKHLGSKKTVGTSTAAKATSVVQQTIERSPTPIVLSKNSAADDQRTLAEKANSFADNIVNPENHPDKVDEEPLMKQASSDEPTEDDDDESQEDMDKEESPDSPTASAMAGSPNMVTPTTLQDVRSEESKIVETISPPNSIKPMDKESMEKFIEEQKAQQNTGLLCGCI